ncbi:unnamed protein product [Mycena citricolor]|uniref:Uncharacterized protein n=1 Tax=Mycena citricolor TaxID=2018698 RepID=A0AAD2K3U3_9AGAR|nr:unnamed protein product [Mycena citricolor]
MVLLVPARAVHTHDPSVQAFVHPPPYIPGPYTAQRPAVNLPYTPSLSWFCVGQIARYGVDQISINKVRLNYRPPRSSAGYDLLRALIPSLFQPDFSWGLVDPRLWATIVQLYDQLPPIFQTYDIPLSDEHIPLLQCIQPTPNFAMVTLLELPGCSELSDTTVVNLKCLHNLCALDVSSTALSSFGIKVLSETVGISVISDAGETVVPKGPWSLRILRLRHCRGIDDKIKDYLLPFALLCVLDLRDTKCHSDHFFSLAFKPATFEKHSLYHPTPLVESVRVLCTLADDVFSSVNVFSLHINTLYHPARRVVSPAASYVTENTCVTFPQGKTNFVLSSAPKEPQLTAKRRRRRRVSSDPDEPENILGRHGLEDIPDDDYGLEDIPDDYGPGDLAEEELFAHALQERAKSFYLSNRLPAPKTLPRKYVYPAESSLLPSAESAQLMLYKTLPPWRLPERPEQSPATRPVAEAVLVLSKEKKAAMARYSQALAEKRRKISDSAAAEPTNQAVTSAPLARNPFRRKSEGSTGTTDLRPISSFNPPPLPDGMDRLSKDAARNRKARVGVSGRALSRGTSAAFDWKKWDSKNSKLQDKL